jgi:hypothetical protein
MGFFFGYFSFLKKGPTASLSASSFFIDFCVCSVRTSVRHMFLCHRCKYRSECLWGVKGTCAQMLINKSNSIHRLCGAEISTQSDCSVSPAASLLPYSLHPSSSSANQSLLSHHHQQQQQQYRHSQQQQQNSPSLIGGLNLSSSTNTPTSSSSATIPTTASASITTLSNNLYNNNHLYQHHHHHLNTTTGSGHHSSKHNASSSGTAAAPAITHHPTPIEGLTALSSLGGSTLHLTANSLCGGNSNSLGAELGMSHWLSEGPSNSGRKFLSFSMRPRLSSLFLLNAVKSEIKSPTALVESNSLPLAPSHLDSALFCANTVNLDASQSSNAYDHKQDYYNYYNRWDFF